MFFIYIIYSESADKYYIGHTDDPATRLEQHNTVIKNSYTFKFRPWIMKACFEISESRGEARKVENYQNDHRVFIGLIPVVFTVNDHLLY